MHPFIHNSPWRILDILDKALIFVLFTSSSPQIPLSISMKNEYFCFILFWREMNGESDMVTPCCPWAEWRVRHRPGAAGIPRGLVPSWGFGASLSQALWIPEDPNCDSGQEYAQEDHAFPLSDVLVVLLLTNWNLAFPTWNLFCTYNNRKLRIL